MLSVNTLNVIPLSVVMQSAIMISVITLIIDMLSGIGPIAIMLRVHILSINKLC